MDDRFQEVVIVSDATYRTIRRNGGESADYGGPQELSVMVLGHNNSFRLSCIDFEGDHAMLSLDKEELELYIGMLTLAYNKMD